MSEWVVAGGSLRLLGKRGECWRGTEVEGYLLRLRRRRSELASRGKKGGIAVLPKKEKIFSRGEKEDWGSPCAAALVRDGRGRPPQKGGRAWSKTATGS